MVGIKDIAEAAGVSVSTVSNALNNKKNVGEETRKRILQICEELSYRPNPVGRSLKSGKTNTISFSFSDFDRSFYLKIIKGISDFVKENGLDLIICTDKSCEKYMNAGLTCGSIVLDRKIRDDTLQRLAGENYPMIVLDRVMKHPYIKSVVVNNYEPMFELMQTVIERGYRSFGFVGGIEETADHQERFRAFSDALAANHISFQQKNYFTGNYREKSGYMAARILMLGREMPECLVCANDNMAIGAMKAFQENGVRIPEDIAITGFDNVDLAENIGLTTIAVPDYERGFIAARYLYESIQGTGNAETFKIMPVIKLRSSVGLKKRR